jgi:hypothetical protein
VIVNGMGEIERTEQRSRVKLCFKMRCKKAMGCNGMQKNLSGVEWKEKRREKKNKKR